METLHLRLPAPLYKRLRGPKGRRIGGPSRRLEEKREKLIVTSEEVPYTYKAREKKKRECGREKRGEEGGEMEPTL